MNRVQMLFSYVVLERFAVRRVYGDGLLPQGRDRSEKPQLLSTARGRAVSNLTPPSAPLVFPKRADTVCADEQDGHRGAGPRGFTHQWGLRRFPRKQRQGLYHLR